MEFQDVVRRRRMVRSYDTSRPVPPEVIDRIVHNGLRAPSAGMSQGWGFLVLDTPADVARFRDAVRPEANADRWFAVNVDARVHRRSRRDGHRGLRPRGAGLGAARLPLVGAGQGDVLRPGPLHRVRPDPG